MTRINTNVSSLIAQNTLARNNVDLQQSLTRLSTGLRINSGADDPAGLIASEALLADMTSMGAAITNSTRANLLIATADSALGQVSSLLNDVRGLVVEAANTGVMSDSQVAANQLQVDSSLEAINRIAQTTTFQGRRLLDGSMAFTTTISSVPSVTDMQIDQANLGTAGQIAVAVDIASAATVAEIANTGFGAGSQATATITLSAGTFISANSTTNGVYINAKELGTAVGVGVTLVNDTNTANRSVTYDGTTITVTDNFSGAAAGANLDSVVSAINNDADTKDIFVATALGTTTVTWATADATVRQALAADTITLRAATTGADYNQLRVSVVEGSTTTNSSVYNATAGTLTLTIGNAATGQTLASLASSLQTSAGGRFLFSTPAGTSASSTQGSGYVNTNNEVTQQNATTGNTGGNLLLGDLVLSVGGASGREVFNFQKDASINQVVSAVNLVSDATGVSATRTAGQLTLNSTMYGTRGTVDTEVISEGTGGVFTNSWVGGAATGTGTDIKATVNGVTANGDGNTLSINTSTLDLSITVSDGSSTSFNFDITGGGALFQLGPDVVTNQQARLGIQNLNTSQMGGTSGRLYELTSGGDKTLAKDPNAAYAVVSDVISKVATLRGRLGAFQRTTVDTNIASLTDTLVNLTDAESNIRDADFAAESSSLTRAQILVQSGTSVLAFANQNPQSVLSLLR
ncbi:MAG: flagellin N-terminal helical domain-containing protein [Pirellulaceae bacterium]